MPVFPFATNNTALKHKLPLHSISTQFIFIVGQQTSIKAYREQKAQQLIWSYLLSAYISPVGRWLHRSIRVQVGCHINRAGPLTSPSTWTRVCSRRRYRPDRFHRLSLDSQKKRKKKQFTNNGQPWPSSFSLDQWAGPKARSRFWTPLRESSCRFLQWL